MNKKPIILFDLDNTLFDTPSYRKSVFTKIGNFDLCQEIYDGMLKESGYFFPDIFAELVSDNLKNKMKKDEILRIIFDQKNFRDNLHKEVLASLKILMKVGEVGILSQGDNDFQRAKISHFKHLLNDNHIHIVKDKKSSMEGIFKKMDKYKIYFIDDIMHMLEVAKKIDPDITTIWMMRGRYAEKQKPIPGFKPDAEVENLSEVVKIIRSSS